MHAAPHNLRCTASSNTRVAAGCEQLLVNMICVVCIGFGRFRVAMADREACNRIAPAAAAHGGDGRDP